MADQTETAMNLADAPIFEPLQSENEIRLLTIHPGLTENLIECTLSKATLHPAPRYEALSYVWGSLVSEASIHVNNHHIRIRRNLWQFLHHLRHDTLPRVVWVDALCISQSNLIEKAQQVQQIGEIFSKARVVNAWLGSTFEGPKFSGIQGWIQFFWAICHRVDTQFLERVIHIIDKTYWTRTWIVQEVITAQRLDLHFENEILRWECFMNMHQKSLNYLDSVHEMISGAQCHLSVKKLDFIQRLDERRTKFQLANLGVVRVNDLPTSSQLHSNSLLSSLQPFLFTSCSDPRDKVYSLLSVTNNSVDVSQIAVDYSMNPEELFLRVLNASAPVKSARESENLRTSMELSWYQIFVAAAALEPTENDPNITDVSRSKPKIHQVKAKLRYVGRLYDMKALGDKGHLNSSKEDNLTVFRNILPGIAEFTGFRTTSSVNLDQELWQVALSSTILICSPQRDSARRLCTGVALISSKWIYSRPLSDEAQRSLPSFDHFKDIQFEVELRQATAGGSVEVDDYGLYDPRNEGSEYVYLSLKTWRIVCLHYHRRMYEEAHF